MPAHIREATPRQLGFRQPGEWTRHAATWAAWPFDDQEWRGYLGPAREEFAAFIEAVAHHEPVRLLVHDERAELDARSRLRCEVEMVRVPLDDVWLRDSGPIFVTRDDGQVSFVHWGFNAWGKKFEWRLDDDVPEAIADALDLDHFDVDEILEGGSIDGNGLGIALSTRQCLLHPERNPALDEARIEDLLRDHLGIEQLIWLDRGLEGDHTDGHVDTIARFADPETIVTCVCEDRDDPNHEVLSANLERLQRARDSRGRPFRIVEVPLPASRREVAGERLPLTYVNFYLVNGGVMVPQYDDPNDERALDILRGVFTDRAVVGLRSSFIITSGGSFHCLTQQQPHGTLWRRSA